MFRPKSLSQFCWLQNFDPRWYIVVRRANNNHPNQIAYELPSISFTSEYLLLLPLSLLGGHPFPGLSRNHHNYSRSNMKPKSNRLRSCFVGFRCFGRASFRVPYCFHFLSLSFHFLHFPFICMHLPFILHSCPLLFLSFGFMSCHVPFGILSC